MIRKKQPIIAIIGGGAAGIMAAIQAARKNREIKIIILERMDRIGKKILATGNGRCNFTNVNIDESNYYSVNRNTRILKTKFVNSILSRFSVTDTLYFFETLGIVANEESNGKIFPYCGQASAILDVLRLELEHFRVDVKTKFDVKSVQKDEDKFIIKSYKNDEIKADKLIIAAGGCASPDLGSNGSGFELLKSFGHKITIKTPALVQFLTEKEDIKGLQGIKFNGRASAILKEKEISSIKGEILFTDYGLSGPPIFQLSTIYPLNKSIKIKIDFLPDFSKEKINEMLYERKNMLRHLKMEHFFTGLLNKRIGNMIAKKSGIERLSFPIKELDDKTIYEMSSKIKGTYFNILKPNSWNNAQVTAGGAHIDGFNPNTLESRIIPGLYAVGEVLDIYGDCGGYNLQWAWATGYAAGISAAEL